jgi:D-inositol-3-phosphate glycosyltransferase
MISRVAYLSMHTSPLLQPGVGDAGGMNVYIDELSRTMAQRGVEVDVFTRRHEPGLPDVVEAGPGYRVHHIDAGPQEIVPVRSLARFVRDYSEGVLGRLEAESVKPDIVHSHYWLSGWAGLMIKRQLEVPLANSFHTLGRIKDLTKRDDESPEPLLRIAAEHEVIEGSDCVVASTPLEAEDLLDHYGADPARLCTSPPGVDHTVFSPGDRESARRELCMESVPTILFVGRIQPLKGVDVVVDAFARIRAEIPNAHLCVIGGPSGPDGADEVTALKNRIHDLGLTDRVLLRDPVLHTRLALHYRAADVLVLPSRSESFGLVAAEAQSCGLPVVAAAVGGLRHVVSDDESGLLVEGWDAADHAEAVLRVLREPGLKSRLSAGAVEWSERFSWDATAHRFLELYEGAIERAGED